ncbi:MAG: GNAT family N-acetyltransferase [Bacteroidales bacterium]|nr:GNAT family N-acetyltransferase [Bacteroidales bacterium]
MRPIYRMAKNVDAEQLLRTRRHTVINNRTGAYSDALLQAWAPTVTKKSIAAEEKALENPDRVTIVAEKRAKMIGLCTLGISEGLLKQCYVLPEYSGMGIARQLVRQIETIAKERGLRSLKLSSSLIALDFYKKMGYHELNRYDFDLGNGLQMPCVMMEKTL